MNQIIFKLLQFFFFFKLMVDLKVVKKNIFIIIKYKLLLSIYIKVNLLLNLEILFNIFYTENNNLVTFIS